MKRSCLYLSIHHQEATAPDHRGVRERDLRDAGKKMLASLLPIDRHSSCLPPEESLASIRDCLEYNRHIWERRVRFEENDSRTLLLAVMMELDVTAPVPESGLWYNSSDEREGLVYFAQMVVLPCADSLSDDLSRFQSGLRRFQRLIRNDQFI